MTAVLQQIFDQVSHLPPPQQERVAELIQEYLEMSNPQEMVGYTESQVREIGELTPERSSQILEELVADER